MHLQVNLSLRNALAQSWAANCGRASCLGFQRSLRCASEVSILEQRSSELPVEACARLVPAVVKLREQSQTLAATLAQRLAVEGGRLAPVELAAAAQGLAALRALPKGLALVAEKVLRRQIHLCTPRAVVHFAAALSEGRGTWRPSGTS